MLTTSTSICVTERFKKCFRRSHTSRSRTTRTEEEEKMRDSLRSILQPLPRRQNIRRSTYHWPASH